MQILILLTGIIIGSFLNVCIYRIPKKESISFPPSNCTSCEEKLKSWDLIPIVSFIFLKGRCRYCNEKISIIYPMVELLNGLIYLAIYNVFGLSIISAIYMLLSSILIVISFIDYNYKIIPDKLIVLGFIIITPIHILYNFPSSFINGLLGLFISGGIFLTIAFISKGGMGGGDVKLISLLGYLLGLKILMVILISFILGALISVVLLATNIKSRKDAIAFGPFISISGIIVILFFDEILDIYLKIII